MTLTFNTHLPSITLLVVSFYQLSGHRLQPFLKNPVFSFFSKEKPMLPNLTCHKLGQGQPRVTIYSNSVELESPILHTKFQDHRTSGSGEEDF